jgi:hypothetical protein
MLLPRHCPDRIESNIKHLPTTSHHIRCIIPTLQVPEFDQFAYVGPEAVRLLLPTAANPFDP